MTRLLLKSILLLPITSFILSTAFAKSGKKTDADVRMSSWGVYSGYSNSDYKGFKYHSRYIPMRDSTLIAIDVFLPKKLEAGKKVPTVLYLTRYVRSIRAKFPLNLFKHPVLVVVSEEEIKFFTSHGYACIIVDARGTGASLGERRMEFSPEEIADGKDIVDWIISQPWSNGNVGSTGVSYVGTTAEMLLVNQHPAVKACIPRSNIFDLYNYIMFPGGVRMGPFVDIWGKTTQSLDHNDFGVFGKKAKNLVIGINPVKGDKGRKIYKTALHNHWQNFDITQGLRKVQFRDDVHEGLGVNSEVFSIHHYRKQIENSGTPIYRIGGWYDGALAKSCLDGWLNTNNTAKVLIGPWDHGPQNNASPFATSKKVEFDVMREMLRFFDYHLKGIKNGLENEPLLRYYTVGAEKWETDFMWPPKNTTSLRFELNPGLTLQETTNENGIVEYEVDYTASTGLTTRWNSITQLFMNGPTHYDNRAEENKKLLCFTSPPVEKDFTITGHPSIHLNWSADADDATVFAYMEEVQADGKVIYITEGMLRPLHRKITEKPTYNSPIPAHSYLSADAAPYRSGETVRLEFDFLPISYKVSQGSSIRVSIGGSDVGHFDTTEVKPRNFFIHINTHEPSFVDLPVSGN